MNGIIGKKLGMTRVFDKDGKQIPVTVVAVGPCTVVQTKTPETDGYTAVQLGFGDQKEQRVNRPQLGHFKKAETTPKRVLREFRVDDLGELKPGAEVNASMFEGVSHVDIIGTTKGRGFQGVVRRYRMGGGRATHGSGFHRRPGSIGMNKEPSRVFKGKHMPGHMGNVQITTQNLEVVQCRPEDHVLLIRGAVPGPTGGILVVNKALKKNKATASS